MMQKITRDILNNNLDKFRCNFKIKCTEQPLKLLISAHHCSVLTGIISHHKQPPYINQMQ